nr:PQQ-dependent sugar dehydrogenase [Flammeovirgaceae bacterium]
PYSNSPQLKPLIQIENIESDFERGLLTLLIDPDFNSNKYFYTYGTTKDFRLKLSRFTLNDETASIDSEYILWQTKENYLVPTVNHYHMGGAIDFANDGTIFLVIGDLEEAQNAQNLKEYNGKLLRLNKDGSIPQDNPFYNNGNDKGPNGELPEIYSWGLRNPFKGTYDKQTETFIMGEVGGNNHDSSWEDVHYAVKGGNFGWPDCGESGRNEDGSCLGANFIDPIYTYAHKPNRGNSITGGFIYRGTNLPQEYQGQYIFADYAQSWIRYIKMDENLVVVNGNGEENATTIKNPSGSGLVDIEQGPNGELFYLVFNRQGQNTGELRKIYYGNENTPIIRKATANITKGGAPLEVKFTGEAKVLGDLPLKYTWSFGDGNTSNEPSPSHSYIARGIYKARLSVNLEGQAPINSQEIIITVGLSPSVKIISPVNKSLFTANQLIQFSGEATDPDGTLSEESFSWDIEFLHDDHTHPFIAKYTGQSGEVKMASSGHSFHGETGFIFTLTVTDKDDLLAIASDTIYPKKSDIKLLTEPLGLKVHVEGQPRISPYTVDELSGFESEVSVSSPQVLDGKLYQFIGWSDGGAKTHLYINSDSENTLTAHFSEISKSRIEVEDNFTIFKDTGDNKISVVEFEDASQKKAISIFDKGDIIEVPINLVKQNESKYLINVRVRSGTSISPTSFWPDKYSFEIDDKEVYFTGDKETLVASPELGGMYLGIMRSEEVMLPPGLHHLKIEANIYWGVIDYIELINISDDTPPTTPVLSPSKITSNTIALKWDPSLDASGIDGYIIYQNGDSIDKTNQIEFVASKLSPNENYEFSVVGIDNTNNYSMLSNSIKAKTSSPEEYSGVIIKSPSENQIVFGPEVVFDYVLYGNPDNYDHIYLTIDDLPKKPVHDFSVASYKFNNISPGEHKIKIELVKGHGKPILYEEATARVKFRVEYKNDSTSLPGIIILAPEQNQLVFGDKLNVKYLTFGNTDEIKNIKLVLDQDTTKTISNQSGSFVFENVAPGKHEISALIYNENDMVIQSPNAKSTINFQLVSAENKPRVNIKSPVNKGFVYENDLKVEFELFGDNNLYDHIELILDDTLIVPVYNLNESYYTFKRVEKGMHKLTIQMVTSHPQPLPNPESQDEVTFTVEGKTVQPTVKIISPLNNQIYYNSKVKVDYELGGDSTAFDHLHFYLGDGPHETVVALSGSYTLKKEVEEGEYLLKVTMVNEGHDFVGFETAQDSVNIIISHSLVAPSELKARVENHKNVILSWHPIISSNIEEYIIEVSENENGPFDIIGKVNSSTDSLIHSGVNENTILFYRIKSSSNGELSPPSAILSVKTNNQPELGNFKVIGTEDEPFSLELKTINGHFKDVDGDKLLAIQFPTFSDKIKILKGDQEIDSNQVISLAAIDSLTFIPELNWFGSTSIDIQGYDGYSFSSNSSLNIEILGVNDAPYDLILSDSTIEEGNLAGAIIGSFITKDVDDDNHIYSIKKNDGDSLVRIDKNHLIANSTLKYDSQNNAFNIEIQSDDENGGILKKTFNIKILSKSITSIPEEYLIEGISIFPNPFDSRVYLEINNNYFGKYQIDISDATGKKIFEQRIEKYDNSFYTTIPLKPLADGLYFIQITSEQKTFVQKIYKGN